VEEGLVGGIGYGGVGRGKTQLRQSS